MMLRAGPAVIPASVENKLGVELIVPTNENVISSPNANDVRHNTTTNSKAFFMVSTS
jgi:hypothetical protein